MAPGILDATHVACAETRPSKKVKLSEAADVLTDEVDDVATAVPSHPLDIKPAGNAYTASENIKAHSGSFARLPDELLNHVFESFDADSLVRLGSTCRFLYAFTRLDELWRALFVSSPPDNFQWRSTWRSTYLGTAEERATFFSCKHLFSDVLYRPFQCANLTLEPFVTNVPSQNAIQRLQNLTREEYSEKWTGKPFILTAPVKEWPVYGKWTPEYLLKKYPDVEFRAEAVDWPMSKYIDYMTNSRDESPLYVFDRAFVEKTGITTDRDAPDAAYWSPDCFGEDLFGVLGEYRPDCRWMILGPKRSGSTFHKDPNATNAWNAVLTGCKYWLMFPSSSALPPPPGVILSDDQSEITSPLSIAEYLLTFHSLARSTPGCREGICYAGEILHVPSGWFHLVLNLEDSLALTQNFVPRKRLPDVLGFLQDQRDQVSGFKEDICDQAYEIFVERLGEKHPDVLKEGLAELEKKARKGRGKWEELTKADEEQAEGGFSFGFGFGDGDEDEETP
ncbi:Clavaminate synthase-like protein [Lentithecium fluviatile CBS 122367]|uniref:Clavaminate synthase-like protein n=1 Tax=Lentithecium fluviatile CBS 122367 TaxID=1168545 RepID=A0A6G1IX35_9PLEO|nr:Clavaminate synthase-like protein [Lentithecium fluviatile CBS 122367]